MRYLKDYELENMGKTPRTNKHKKMAKDRFSKFKKSNYNKEYRWGNHTNLNYNVIPNRKVLTKIQKDWIINLIKNIKNESSKTFLRSILEQDKVPTEKQKEIIKTIIKNG